MKAIILIVFCTNLISFCYSESESFVATNEWQDIKEGQSIPAGLHVRINLETGKKEAKLLDEENVEKTDSKKDLSIVSAASDRTDNNAQVSNDESREERISQTLEHALKQLPDKLLKIDYSPDSLEKIRKNYKSYDEVKRSFNDMKMNFKSDADIITELIKQYKNVTHESKKSQDFLRLLENFNYLVHQIDNALWFIDEGGLELIMPMIVNQTDLTHRIHTLRLLGALTQNNPKAQIKVFERNFGIHIGRILLSSTNSEELSTALYAFGSILRKFPHSQKEILSKVGTKALISVLGKTVELKVKAKAITIISDLLQEREAALSKASAETQSKVAQYEEVTLDLWLKENQFCEIVEDILIKNKAEFIKQADATDYFIQALQTTQSVCFSVWSESPLLRHSLLTLKNRYQTGGDEYLIEISTAIQSVIKSLYGRLEKRDEL